LDIAHLGRASFPGEITRSSLPAGTAGAAANYTEHIKPVHIIRKVILRQIAILNYVNPF
jgi:hypothetical protein